MGCWIYAVVNLVLQSPIITLALPDVFSWSLWMLDYTQLRNLLGCITLSQRLGWINYLSRGEILMSSEFEFVEFSITFF